MPVTFFSNSMTLGTFLRPCSPVSVDLHEGWVLKLNKILNLGNVGVYGYIHFLNKIRLCQRKSDRERERELEVGGQRNGN